MRADRYPPRQRAISEHLDLVRGADNSALGHQRRIDRLDAQRGQPLEGDHYKPSPPVLGLLQPAKSALRHAPLERHLPTLVSRRRVAARARALALVAASGGLAAAGADSAAHARGAALGARGGLERM